MYRTAIIWILAALLYMVWPYDLIPDFIVFIGWIDDLLIAGLALYMAFKSVKKKLESRPSPKNVKEDDVIDVEIDED